MKIFLRIFFILFLFSLVPGPVFSEETLSPEQIERVKACKRLLEEIDTKPLPRTLRELERSTYPELHLRIMEAMANTYVELVREHKVVKLKDKHWLYGMIAMNMANLQFGGGIEGDRDAALNHLIQRKLLEHLPANIAEHPGFSKSVE